MSSKAKRLENKVVHTLHKFKEVEMYNNILGSFLISLYILQATDKTPKELCRFYKQEKKRWLKGEINEQTWMYDIIDKLTEEVIETEDGHFIEHTNNTYIPYGQIALVESEWNKLIVPYLDLGNGPQVLSIREDGLIGPTLKHGTVHVIVKEEKECGKKEG